MGIATFIYDQPSNVPLLGRVVEPGEAIELDDELLTEYLWPESRWTVELSKPKVAPKSAAKKEE